MAGLFDKVVVGINRGMNTVSEGSKMIVEKARLSTQIQDLERDKDKMLLNMGNLVYNLYQSGEVHIEQCEAICDEVTSYYKRISDLQNQLQSLDGTRPQTEFVTNAGVNTVVCGQCGAANKSTSKFCSGCGKPLV